MTNVAFLIENARWIAALAVCAATAIAFASSWLGASSRERALRGETVKLLHERKRLGIELVSARAEMGSLRQELAREGLQLRLALDALLEAKSAPGKAQRAMARTPPPRAAVAATPPRAVTAPTPPRDPGRAAPAAPDATALLAKVTAFLSTADLAPLEDDAFEQPSTVEARTDSRPDHGQGPASSGDDRAQPGIAPSKARRPAGSAVAALAAARLLSTAATSAWASRPPEEAEDSWAEAEESLVA